MTTQSRVFLVEDLGRGDQPATLLEQNQFALGTREREEKRDTRGKT